MVKGAARNGASSSQGGPPPQALPQMQAGQNVHDPLTQLNGHMGFGLMGGLNPFADLGLNPNDPNLVSPSCTGCVRCEVASHWLVLGSPSCRSDQEVLRCGSIRDGVHASCSVPILARVSADTVKSVDCDA